MKKQDVDKRGDSNFGMYLLNDTRPIYAYRATNIGLRLVNANMFDFKEYVVGYVMESLKAKSSGNVTDIRNLLEKAFLASYNIEETSIILETLGFHGKFYRKRRFDSLVDVFDTLNAAEISSSFHYVAMRNFEGYPDKVALDEHLDVDLMCSDYYTAKRLLDARTASNPPHFIPPNHMVDFGRWRILNNVEVQGVQILFDLRHVGDNYYDEKLERHMLSRKEKKYMEVGDGEHSHYFYKPDHQTWLYTVLYHALVHKQSISNTYKQHFFQRRTLKLGLAG